MRIEQKTLTILVAEDNGSNFKLIESILGKVTIFCMPGTGRKLLNYTGNTNRS